MAYRYATPVQASVQTPPIVAELESVFATLDDKALIDGLIGPTRRGPKGHPVRVLWRCLVAKYVLNLSSTAALLRTLRDNPFVAQACGIESPDSIPHEATFSRFIKRLASTKHLHHVKDVSRSLVRDAYARLPNFGKRVAMDATVLRAWSNGAKLPHADKEAGWSVKKGTHGKMEFTYGWKLHLLVDAEYEFPIAANVSAGNVHDSQRASNLLSEARFTYSKFKPDFTMADSGYSGEAFFKLIRTQYGGQPIVQVNKAHKRLGAREAVRIETPEWKALYKQRQSVERVFSRLKGQRALNRITLRRLRKVTAHVYLSLIALQAMASK